MVGDKVCVMDMSALGEVMIYATNMIPERVVVAGLSDDQRKKRIQKHILIYFFSFPIYLVLFET